MQLWKEHLGMLDFKDWEGLLNGDKPAHYDTVQEHPSSFSTESLSSEETIRNFEDEKPNNVLNHENRSGASTDPSSNQRFDAKVLDPLAEHFYKDIWNSRAQNNTLIYRELFRCVPDDTIHTFEQHRRFLPTHVPHGHVADTDLHGRDIKNRLNQVQGHIVQFPCDYLKDENMLGSLIRETVTPMVIFT
jgi:hypothetical protein